MTSTYEKTLFQRASIKRWQKSTSKYDSKETLVEIVASVSVGLALKTSSLTDGNGNVKTTQYYLMHTLFNDIKAGDIVTVTDPGGEVEYGTFRCSKPYPVMDTKGIHHYEITLDEESDA